MKRLNWTEYYGTVTNLDLSESVIVLPASMPFHREKKKLLLIRYRKIFRLYVLVTSLVDASLANHLKCY
jgi:hypothetical protein